MIASQHSSVVRDITYANSARSRVGRVFIRGFENITGRPKLLRMAKGYQDEVDAGRNFWEVIQERYRLTLDLRGGGMDNIPKEGPLVLVANHPYGILDGLAMGRILSQARGGNFKIIAHTIFRRAKELEEVILPIDFAETKEAQRLNIQTRKAALDYLASGGAIGIFPGGTVSTAVRPFERPMDPFWKTFTAKMIAKSEATVVPMFFEGTNSRIFQIASHLHNTLRMALLISEFESRVGEPIRATVGKALPASEIHARRRDSRELMEYLRRETYRLDPNARHDDYPLGLYLG